MVLQPIIEKTLHIFWTFSVLYTINQLALLFFLYAFLGWLLEIGYRSIRNRRLVNPGVLRGPIVPIYGIGGVVISMIYLLIQNEPLLMRLAVYAISISVLELITGEALLRLVKKRYWDYSDDPLNLHGHICLSYSAAWALLAFVIEKTTFPLSLYLFSLLPEGAVAILNRFAFSLMLIDVTYTLLMGTKRTGPLFKRLQVLGIKQVRLSFLWLFLPIESFSLRNWPQQKIKKQRHKLGMIINQAFNKKNKGPE